MVECFLDVEKVRGSSPLSRTMKRPGCILVYLGFLIEVLKFCVIIVIECT